LPRITEGPTGVGLDKVAGPQQPKEDLNRFLGVTVTQVSIVIGTKEEEGFKGLERPPIL